MKPIQDCQKRKMKEEKIHIIRDPVWKRGYNKIQISVLSWCHQTPNSGLLWFSTLSTFLTNKTAYKWWLRTNIQKWQNKMYVVWKCRLMQWKLLCPTYMYDVPCIHWYPTFFQHRESWHKQRKGSFFIIIVPHAFVELAENTDSQHVSEFLRVHNGSFCNLQSLLQSLPVLTRCYEYDKQGVPGRR